MVATEAETGEGHYFEKADVSQDHYDIMKASCAIPAVCHPYEVNGIPYFDGALTDPVPVKKAFELGCDKVVLLLTKPKDFVRDLHEDDRLVRLIHHHYSAAAEGLHLRAQRYNESVAYAKTLEAEGKVLIVAPEHTCGVTTLTRDPELLKELYNKGYEDGHKINDFLLVKEEI